MLEVDTGVRSIITEQQVLKHLSPEMLIPTLEQAFRRMAATTISAPLRMQLGLPNGGVFFTMPCWESSSALFGVKLVTVGSGPERVQAEYMLYDCETRRNVAMIAANHLTDIRTACVSAIATKLLARKEPKVLGIFGTGRQAFAHVSVLTGTEPFTSVLCCGSSQQKSEEFADRLRKNHGINAYPSSSEECLSQADVVCCCTTSTQPLFHGSRVRPGTHFNLVGAFQKHTREVDGETLQRSRLCVETYEGVLSDGGDVLMALSEGLISEQHIIADLHELLSFKKTGRLSPAEITVFKSVGYAYEDLVAAVLVYEIVRRQEKEHLLV